MSRVPRCSIWMFSPYNRELRFWNTLGSMAARDAAIMERNGKGEANNRDALDHWRRARLSAGDAGTKAFIDNRIAELSKAAT